MQRARNSFFFRNVRVFTSRLVCILTNEYNLEPSFRNESCTNRHLWHIKVELCFSKLEDIMSLVEIFLRNIAFAAKDHGMKTASLVGTEYHNSNFPSKINL
jgi:aspartyl/asparaginyl-tRNA synthetase